MQVAKDLVLEATRPLLAGARQVDAAGVAAEALLVVDVVVVNARRLCIINKKEESNTTQQQRQQQQSQSGRTHGRFDTTRWGARASRPNCAADAAPSSSLQLRRHNLLPPTHPPVKKGGLITHTHTLVTVFSWGCLGATSFLASTYKYLS